MPKRGETLLSVSGSPLGAFSNQRFTLNVHGKEALAPNEVIHRGIETDKGVVDLADSNAVVRMIFMKWLSCLFTIYFPTVYAVGKR